MKLYERYKEQISISVDRYLLDKAKELVKKGEFGSVSGVITIALSEFFANYESYKKSKESKDTTSKQVKNMELR